MEFPHTARWNHVQIEDYGTIMPTGYLFGGKIIVLAMHVQPEGLEGYLQTTPAKSLPAGSTRYRAPGESRQPVAHGASPD